jgi:hypothetical protein
MKNALLFTALAGALVIGPGCSKDKDKKKGETKKDTPTTDTKSTGPGAARPGMGGPGMGGPGMGHGRRMRDPAARAQFMKARLGLDDEQTKKVEEVYKSDVRGPERADKIKAILKPEQLKKWEEMRARMRGMRMRGMRGMRGPRDPAARRARMKAALGLDDEQMKKIEEIDKSGVRGKERMDKVKAILKPEQLKKWEEHIKSFRMRRRMGPGAPGAADDKKPDDKKADDK